MKGTPLEIKLSPAERVIVGRVEEVAKKMGKTMVEVALAWVSSKVSSPIVGISSIPRLDDNVVAGFELTEDDMKYLEEP
jgi:aryl-alcohol dehydrogenase-like predicted oxidoreductase